eukprot:COSAG01_NODE_3815_length_5671_cov_2.363604_7_plen_63_part_00
MATNRRADTYAGSVPSPAQMVAQGTEKVVSTPSLRWSPDSRYIATAVIVSGVVSIFNAVHSG